MRGGGGEGGEGKRVTCEVHIVFCPPLWQTFCQLAVDKLALEEGSGGRLRRLLRFFLLSLNEKIDGKV